MRINAIIISAILCLPLQAQNMDRYQNNDTSRVMPIESVRLQGPREASDEEKEYARRLAEDRAQQAQIDYNLPTITEDGQTIAPTTFYYPEWGFGARPWRLHKGLNVNIGASAFASFGHGPYRGAGFSQDVSLMYVENLSPKATLAVGGYLNHLTYRGDNYFVGGVNAVFSYQFDDHWSAYAFVQKAFPSNNYSNFYGSPHWGAYSPWQMAYGYAPMMYGGYGYGMGSWGYGMADSRMMDRIGGGVTYQWGSHNQNAISINVEFDRMPTPRNSFYNQSRYDYPVR